MSYYVQPTFGVQVNLKPCDPPQNNTKVPASVLLEEAITYCLDVEGAMGVKRVFGSVKVYVIGCRGSAASREFPEHGDSILEIRNRRVVLDKKYWSID